MADSNPPTLTPGARQLRLDTNLGLLKELNKLRNPKDDPTYWYIMGQIKADRTILNSLKGK